MTRTKVAIRYANSLLETSVEKKILDEVSGDMEFVSQTLDANPELARVLISPVIKPQLKLTIFQEIFSKRLSRQSMEFLEFVIDKKREDILPEIITKFLRLKDDHIGLVKVDVSTAFELSGEQAELLRSKLETVLGKTVELRFKLDQDILGGFVARVDDLIYDASLKHQLYLLKKQFVKGGSSLN